MVRSVFRILIFCVFAFAIWHQQEVHSVVLLSDLDFWYFEHLENQELRGGDSLQLNSKPLVIDSIDNPTEIQYGAWLKNIGVETGFSSLLPDNQNREGSWISRGGNYTLSSEFGYVSDAISFWFEPAISFHENDDLTEYEAGRLQPVSSNKVRYPEQEESYTEARFKSAYLMVPFSNWYWFLGSDNLRFGAGKHDTLHLSNSVESFPMTRLGTIDPWDTFLGYISFLTFVGELEKERHIPRAKFAGLRLDWSTEKRVEFGISRSWIAGGDGQNNSFSHLVWDLFAEIYKPSSGIEAFDDFRNQQLVFDFRVKIPEIDSVIYGEYGREDHEYSYDGIVKRWYHTQANIIGVKTIDIFFDNTFIILERAETVERYPFPEFIPWFETEDDPAPAPGAWYNHSQYRSGWTYKGTCLGHHLGADSVDEFFGAGWQSSSFSLMIYVDREIHGVLTLDEKNQEKKTEAGIKGFYSFSENWQMSYLLQAQRFENYGQVHDNSVESSIYTLELKYVF